MASGVGGGRPGVPRALGSVGGATPTGWSASGVSLGRVAPWSMYRHWHVHMRWSGPERRTSSKPPSHAGSSGVGKDSDQKWVYAGTIHTCDSRGDTSCYIGHSVRQRLWRTAAKCVPGSQICRGIAHLPSAILPLSPLPLSHSQQHLCSGANEQLRALRLAQFLADLRACPVPVHRTVHRQSVKQEQLSLLLLSDWKFSLRRASLSSHAICSLMSTPRHPDRSAPGLSSWPRHLLGSLSRASLISHSSCQRSSRLHRAVLACRRPEMSSVRHPAAVAIQQTVHLDSVPQAVREKPSRPAAVMNDAGAAGSGMTPTLRLP